MMRNFFGLTEQPFGITADPRFFFFDAERRAAFEQIVTALRTPPRVAIVSGERGSGKTIFLRRIFEEREGLGLRACFLSCHGELTTEEIAQTAGIFWPSKSRSNANADFRSVLLILDDAHLISETLLKTLIESARTPPLGPGLSLMLAGEWDTAGIGIVDNLLGETGAPCQRVALEPLPARDVSEYVRHRLGAAGYHGPPLFEPAGLERIATHSRGNPLMINCLCSAVLVDARLEGKHIVSAAAVDRAATHLHPHFGLDHWNPEGVSGMTVPPPLPANARGSTPRTNVSAPVRERIAGQRRGQAAPPEIAASTPIVPMPPMAPAGVTIRRPEDLAEFRPVGLAATFRYAPVRSWRIWLGVLALGAAGAAAYAVVGDGQIASNNPPPTNRWSSAGSEQSPSSGGIPPQSPGNVDLASRWVEPPSGSTATTAGIGLSAPLFFDTDPPPAADPKAPLSSQTDAPSPTATRPADDTAEEVAAKETVALADDSAVLEPQPANTATEPPLALANTPSPGMDALPSEDITEWAESLPMPRYTEPADASPLAADVPTPIARQVRLDPLPPESANWAMRDGRSTPATAASSPTSTPYPGASDQTRLAAVDVPTPIAQQARLAPPPAIESAALHTDEPAAVAAETRSEGATTQQPGTAVKSAVSAASSGAGTEKIDEPPAPPPFTGTVDPTLLAVGVPTPIAMQTRLDPPPSNFANAVIVAASDGNEAAAASAPPRAVAPPTPREPVSPPPTGSGMRPQPTPAFVVDTTETVETGTATDLSVPQVPATPPSRKGAAKSPLVDLDSLLAKGDTHRDLGDVASARLFYQLAWNNGSAEAATALGETFDPVYLERLNVAGTRSRPGDAAAWYRKAVDEGDDAAATHLENLRQWLERAARRGNRDAAKVLETLP